MSKQWNKIIVIFVILALIQLILETTPYISKNYKNYLIVFDGFITLVFMIDFYLKIRIKMSN
jgi:hypothetical protein